MPFLNFYLSAVALNLLVNNQLNSSLWHIIVTIYVCHYFWSYQKCIVNADTTKKTRFGDLDLVAVCTDYGHTMTKSLFLCGPNQNSNSNPNPICCRNHDWLTETMAKNYLPKLSALAGIWMKKGFIGHLQSVIWCIVW